VGNREFLLRDDPQLIKHLEMKKEDGLENISYSKYVKENDGLFGIGFNKRSRGFSGFEVKWHFPNKMFRHLVKNQNIISSLDVLGIKKFGSKDKYFLGCSENCDLYVNKQVHDYLFDNFQIDVFGENRDNRISYLKDDLLVALVSPFKFFFR
jgi:hypothetical protein